MTDRDKMLSQVKGIAEGLDAEVGDPLTVWVCQGPPRCDLVGDEAVAAQQAGCPWCRKERLVGDRWETEEPAHD